MWTQGLHSRVLHSYPHILRSAYSFTLKLETVCFSEPMIRFYQNTRHHAAEAFFIYHPMLKTTFQLTAQLNLFAPLSTAV
jgi:hypothetical protein